MIFDFFRERKHKKNIAEIRSAKEDIQAATRGLEEERERRLSQARQEIEEEYGPEIDRLEKKLARLKNEKEEKEAERQRRLEEIRKEIEGLLSASEK